jgi:alkylation response protein AidB-like acyl-CoA dehydrogenase
MPISVTSRPDQNGSYNRVTNLPLSITTVIDQPLPQTIARRITAIMSEISQEELDEIYAFAVGLGKQAGQMLRDAAQLRMDGGSGAIGQDEHVQKDNAVDLVTETDENVEAFIKNQITQKYPRHK